jgi:hypothetical protein
MGDGNKPTDQIDFTRRKTVLFAWSHSRVQRDFKLQHMFRVLGRYYGAKPGFFSSTRLQIIYRGFCWWKLVQESHTLIIFQLAFQRPRSGVCADFLAFNP